MPVGVRIHPLDAAVCVFDPKLRAESGRRVAIVVGLLKPFERRRVPSRREQRRDGVFARGEHAGYVVGLILHMLAIVSPSGSENVLAHAFAIEEELVGAEGCCVNPGRFDAIVRIEDMAQRLDRKSVV